MLPILALITLALPQDATCTAETPEAAYRAYEEKRTFLPSGKGLWIGGKPFLPADIVDAKAQKDDLTGADAVGVQLSESGHAKFAEVQRCRVGQPIEISFDGKLISAPMLNEEIKGLKITIAGGFDQAGAESVASALRGIRP
jgi:preprotein translocase subunit SecD